MERAEAGGARVERKDQRLPSHFLASRLLAYHLYQRLDASLRVRDQPNQPAESHHPLQSLDISLLQYKYKGSTLESPHPKHAPAVSTN